MTVKAARIRSLQLVIQELQSGWSGELEGLAEAIDPIGLDLLICKERVNKCD